MATDVTPSAPWPTPDRARAALGDAEQVQSSVARLSATPWPVWFTTCLALYCVALPVVFGGVIADPEWLLPRVVWLVVGVLLLAVFLSLFAVAGRAWQRRTGVALRMDVLPKRIAVPLAISYPAVTVVALVVFWLTGNPLPLFVASVLGIALAVGSHLLFVRLHRRPA